MLEVLAEEGGGSSDAAFCKLNMVIGSQDEEEEYDQSFSLTMRGFNLSETPLIHVAVLFVCVNAALTQSLVRTGDPLQLLPSLFLLSCCCNVFCWTTAVTMAALVLLLPTGPPAVF